MTTSTIKIIDPHLHLFNLNEGKYDWLKKQSPPFWPDKEKINRNFTEADLQLTKPLTLAGFVHIEAGFDNQQPWREIDWLEQNCSLTFKSVAFADISAMTFSNHIEQLIQRQSVVGIRDILDDRASEVLSLDSLKRHFSLLEQHSLSFDAQLSLQDTQSIRKLIKHAKEHPRLKIIINHCGWPLDANTSSARKNWQSNLEALSQCENVAIKLSGWEMSDRNWEIPQVTGLILECLQVFGEKRVMLASNFPLCTFSHSYNELWQAYSHLEDVSKECYTNISFTNAFSWYQFG
ncbi:amidohydrolase family protein [Paraglaciecola sp. 2405UD69-4]|uniref:amidohydrolase family protein n=1 Tax=Paraglaciecola sp. 2405UD69-4 TaxID=3391836 RepID=UPI0039C911FA